MYSPVFNTQVRRFLAAVFMSAALGLLAACGGDDPATPPAPVNQDPSGLYKSGAGISTLDGGSVTDLIGFVHNNRIIAFSIAAHILIDGTISNVTVNNYTATVNVYKNGLINQSNVGVTGTVTNGVQMTGTLNGTTGTAGSGNFTLTFDPLYNRGATNARINSEASNYAGNVMMSISDMVTTNYRVRSVNTYDLNTSKTLPYFTGCIHDGVVSIPSSTFNIYTLSEGISEGVNCDTALFATDYTGFAAVVDGAATDDTLLYAITNASHAVFAVLTH